MSTRILLVEDEENLRETIKLNLELENFHVTAVADGVNAIKTFDSQRFDLVVLDIMIPHINGLEVCDHIRYKNEQVPILFLSARNSTEDRITGLKSGAQDYLVKPFSLEELILRIKILIRSNPTTGTQELTQEIYTFGDYSMNVKSFELFKPNETIKLTKKETLLLKLFIDKKNKVISREEILEKVWGYDVYPTTRTIDNFVMNLRKIIEPNPKSPQFIHAIRSVGYKFICD